MSKICKYCQETKPLDLFVADKRNFDGRAPTCKACSYKRNREWVAANPERNREMKRASKKRVYTIEKRRREYTQGDVARKAAVKKTWNDAHKIERRISAAIRKRHVRRATPSWISEEEKRVVRRFYKAAKLLSQYSEENYHVDHVIPLRGKLVCGLHVPWNLQILEAKTNQQKSYRFDPLAATALLV